MNILLIGNGFDLAHGLPTRYSDFLTFMIKIRKSRNYQDKTELKRDLLDSWDVGQNIKDYVSDFVSDQVTENQYLLKQAISYEYIAFEKIFRNLWLSYFESQQKKPGKWVDLESEISNKIQELDVILAENRRIPTEFTFMGTIFPKENITHSDIFIKILQTDLDTLIHCLEIYLTDCVEKIPVQTISPDIENLKIDKVLSFNYTNTYKRIYGKGNGQIEYDFVHGQVRSSNDLEPNNMVLGIDDYLEGDEQNSNIEFISFKKYFQRIHKKTGCEYKKWIDPFGCPPVQLGGEHNLYIFGHSLDTTDKDILKELIDNPSFNTTIFYHNKEAYASQIANLVRILGKDNLIQKCYGSNAKIEFIEQASFREAEIE